MGKEISNLLESVFLQILKCHFEGVTVGCCITCISDVRDKMHGASKDPVRKVTDSSQLGLQISEEGRLK